MSIRVQARQVCYFVLLVWMLAGAQTNRDGSSYSGMYSFLREGEFVQITVESNGRVIGFISHYADPEGSGGFLDQFFKSGKLDGNVLTFATEIVRGTSFDFRGTIERGEGKSRSDEAYYLLKGTVVENSFNEAKKTSSSRPQAVLLKSFPVEVAPPAQKN